MNLFLFTCCFAFHFLLCIGSALFFCLKSPRHNTHRTNHFDSYTATIYSILFSMVIFFHSRRNELCRCGKCDIFSKVRGNGAEAEAMGKVRYTIGTGAKRRIDAPSIRMHATRYHSHAFESIVIWIPFHSCVRFDVK